MKRAKVFISNTLAAILTEDEAGYEFMYLPEYLASNTAIPVSLTPPKRRVRGAAGRIVRAHMGGGATAGAPARRPRAAHLPCRGTGAVLRQPFLL